MRIKSTLNRLFWVGCIVASFAVGCAGSGNGDRGGMMGLGDQPERPVWADWTPAEAPQGLLPDAFVDEVVAFDYWQIDDAAFKEEAWTGASSVLDFLRRESGDEGGLTEKEKRTATLLLQAFDSDGDRASGPGAGQMDVTYVVSLNPDQAMEGLIVRFYARIEDKDVTPGLAIYLGRTEGDAGGFERAVMWAKSGFDQAESFTIGLKKQADTAEKPGWVAQRLDGLKVPGDLGADGKESAPGESLSGVADLTGSIFEQNFWEPLVGSNYVEAKLRAATQSALPAGVEPALGLQVRERQIEEIYRDTVFVPRAETPPQFM